jgi:hypothetical protein
MIMAMSQKSGPTPPPASNQSRFDSGRAQALPHIQTNFQTPVNPKYDLALFETQVDCSRTVDLFGGARIVSITKLSNSM